MLWASEEAKPSATSRRETVTRPEVDDSRHRHDSHFGLHAAEPLTGHEAGTAVPK